MIRNKLMLFTTILIFLYSSPNLAKELIYVSTTANFAEDYEKFLQEKQLPPEEITDFKSKYSSRVVASLVLISQALKLGGMDAKLRIVTFPNSARERAQVKKGKIAISGQVHWRTEFDSSVHMSSAIIPQGRFIKAILGLANNEKLKDLRWHSDFKQLTTAIVPTWAHDLNLLEEMGVEHIYKAPNKGNLLKMVHAGRVDFILYEFSNKVKDGYFLEDGIKLKVTEKTKIILDGSRHYMVSKLHPQGDRIYKALEAGVKIMKEKGVFEKALYGVGFYPEGEKDWHRIQAKP